MLYNGETDIALHPGRGGGGGWAEGGGGGGVHKGCVAAAHYVHGVLINWELDCPIKWI